MSIVMIMNVNLTSKECQNLLLKKLKEELNVEGSKIVRSENLIFQAGDIDFFLGYFIEVINKHGQKFVDGAVRIYWKEFSDVDELISKSAPYHTVSLKKWEMSAIFVGFDNLSNSWPLGGVCLPSDHEVEAVSAQICDIALNEGKRFFNRYASVQGLFNYLMENGPAAPGTWRLTLEFLLREKLFGASKACEHLNGSLVQSPTGYEKHQKNWLLANKCGSC